MNAGYIEHRDANGADYPQIKEYLHLSAKSASSVFNLYVVSVGKVFLTGMMIHMMM